MELRTFENVLLFRVMWLGHVALYFGSFRIDDQNSPGQVSLRLPVEEQIQKPGPCEENKIQTGHPVICRQQNNNLQEKHPLTNQTKLGFLVVWWGLTN